MKASELIKFLETCDPDTDVLCHGQPIYYVDQLPGYYDGHYNQLIQNDSPNYNIIGFKSTRANKKIELVTYTVEDYIWDQDTLEDLEKLNIQYDSSLHSSTIKGLKEKAQKTIDEVREFIIANKKE